MPARLLQLRRGPGDRPRRLRRAAVVDSRGRAAHRRQHHPRWQGAGRRSAAATRRDRDRCDPSGRRRCARGADPADRRRGRRSPEAGAVPRRRRSRARLLGRGGRRGRSRDWHLRLVRLAASGLGAAAAHASRRRRRSRSLRAELARFADEICPALRSVAPVVSSDGSFTPPEISGADAGAARALRRRPCASRSRGRGPTPSATTRRTTPLAIGRRVGRLPRPRTPSGRSSRRLRSPGPAWSGSACSTAPDGRSTRRRRSLAGLDTMRFTTEHLPPPDGAGRAQRRGERRAGRLPRRRRHAADRRVDRGRSRASATGSTSA